MNETRKEKRLRFFLILVFISIAAAGFYMQLVPETNDPKVLVLRQSSDEGSPRIAVYEYKNGEHLMAVYEVERTSPFKFKTFYASALSQAPEELAPDREGNGFWVKTGNGWSYFAGNLQQAKRDEGFRMASSPYQIECSANGQTLYIKNNTINLPSGTKAKEIHSLSEDGLLWLILTEEDIKIAQIDTKYP
ncbi:hypothetical protein [Cytobacillus oceanisediminis]|nr:hypothetical protein [Cytobacillus oceanisediminis]